MATIQNRRVGGNCIVVSLGDIEFARLCSILFVISLNTNAFMANATPFLLERKINHLVPSVGRSLFQAAGLMLVVGIFILTGCSKKQSAVAPAISAADAPPAPAPANNPVNLQPAIPTTIAAGANGGVDLKALNHAYIGWIIQSHVRPKTFEEFVTKSGVQVPPAPTGKKYVIDQNGFINLADQ
jgi:hypothetical protein